jgi:hypothetical protein
MSTFSPEAWSEAKRQARDLMIEAVRRGQPTTYAAITQRITALRLLPISHRLAKLLDDITLDELKEGRGLLAAAVVQKVSGLPGQGFFEFAYRQGHQFTDERQFWEQAFRALQSHWPPVDAAPGGDAPPVKE